MYWNINHVVSGYDVECETEKRVLHVYGCESTVLI